MNINPDMIELSDAIGLCGVTISIYCYGRVQWQRDYAKRISYSLLNLLASALLIVSLAHHWNLAAFASNLIWGLFSAYGVYRCMKYIWREKSMKKL